MGWLEVATVPLRYVTSSHSLKPAALIGQPCWAHAHDQLRIIPGMVRGRMGQFYSTQTCEGAVNFNMNILPQQGPMEWVTRISAEKLKDLVSGGGNAPKQQAGNAEKTD